VAQRVLRNKITGPERNKITGQTRERIVGTGW
jgi:hypothetical protein